MGKREERGKGRRKRMRMGEKGIDGEGRGGKEKGRKHGRKGAKSRRIGKCKKIRREIKMRAEVGLQRITNC